MRSDKWRRAHRTRRRADYFSGIRRSQEGTGRFHTFLMETNCYDGAYAHDNARQRTTTHGNAQRRTDDCREKLPIITRSFRATVGTFDESSFRRTAIPDRISGCSVGVRDQHGPPGNQLTDCGRRRLFTPCGEAVHDARVRASLAGCFPRWTRPPARHAREPSSAGSSAGALVRKARTCIAITASLGVVLSFE